MLQFKIYKKKITCWEGSWVLLFNTLFWHVNSIVFANEFSGRQVNINASPPSHFPPCCKRRMLHVPCPNTAAVTGGKKVSLGKKVDIVSLLQLFFPLVNMRNGKKWGNSYTPF